MVFLRNRHLKSDQDPELGNPPRVLYEKGTSWIMNLVAL